MRDQVYRLLPAISAVAVLATACGTPGENEPGSEYMPDMGHSISYEANTYFDYYYNQWDEQSVKDRYDLATDYMPVQGTVPRGWAGFKLLGNQRPEDGMNAGQLAQIRENYGLQSLQAIAVPVNGSAPYYYDDTDAGRAGAIADITTNPFPITADGLNRGQELYETFCGICHGNDGGGNGWIYENGAYPAAPRNFLVQEWADTSAGTYYHSIMHGKNVMGAYKDKISYEERFQVIHYIRALQAKALEAEYSPEANTLVPAEAIPGANAPQYVRLLESFSREPIEYESEESTEPEVVPGAGGGRFVPGEVPADTDSTRRVGRLLGDVGALPRPAPEGRR